MSAWRLTFEGREEVADGTLAFRFSRPAGFAFKAGQAIDLVFPGEGSDAPDERHAFSLVGAPFEDGLTVATRMRDSAFKRALGKLAVGGHAAGDGPFGSFTLHGDPSRDAVFIAGGIGITPFMSILRQAFRDAPARRFALVYSNHRPEDAAFLDELQRLERSSDHFRLVATMTDMSRSGRPWRGETGRVDAALISRARAGLHNPVYYVVGPPAMVGAVRGVLQSAGVADDDIRDEAFFGY